MTETPEARLTTIQQELADERERLERGDIEEPCRAEGVRFEKPAQDGEARGERLTAAGRRGEEQVFAGGDRRPGEPLGCGRRDESVAPDGVQQLILGHHLIAPRKQVGEYVEHLRLDVAHLAAAPQFVQLRIQLVITEGVDEAALRHAANVSRWHHGV